MKSALAQRSHSCASASVVVISGCIVMFLFCMWAREYLLIAKTTRPRFDALRARLVAAHPYDVPEIMALPLADGLAKYLSWISENTTPSPNKARSQ
jgi:uncharacterized protein involved in tolerance to divalent cations